MTNDAIARCSRCGARNARTNIICVGCGRSFGMQQNEEKPGEQRAPFCTSCGVEHDPPLHYDS